jgi:spermidine synthase
VSAHAQPRPTAGQRPVATGVAALVPDDDGRRGWTLYVNGMESSHVDLDDPTRLDFEYMRWMAALIDARWQGEDAPRVVHLGGGGCTLPRYLRARLPRARQVVVEIDAGVLELAKQAFGLRSGPRFRLVVAEARTAITEQTPASCDLVVRDAFTGSDVPDHLRTQQFTAAVARALGTDGVYLVNLADGELLAAARREAATLLTAFEHVALVAEPGQLHGRRYGNVVLAGSAAAMPAAAWARQLACDPIRARLLDGEQLWRFASGRLPFTD